MKKVLNRLKLLVMYFRLSPPKRRVLTNEVHQLKDWEIFVFGSNELGLHIGGAARTARLHFYAEEGVSYGHTGKSFAIPTLNDEFQKVSPELLRYRVESFIQTATWNPHKTYLVTEIGCGIAGFDVRTIAPMFSKAVRVDNIVLPKRFWNELL